MRESVKWFAGGMEEVLKENDGKKHWRNFGLLHLLGLLKDEVIELEEVIPKRRKEVDFYAEYIIKECHDVANIAHMIADNAKRIKESQNERLNKRRNKMRRCDVCIHWIPRTDIGHCNRKGTEGIDADDCCDKHMTAEEERINNEEQCPERNN